MDKSQSGTTVAGFSSTVSEGSSGEGNSPHKVDWHAAIIN